MDVQGLMSWFNEHRQEDENYQHNGLSAEEFHASAIKSWDRMTEERQVRILNIVNKFAPGLTIQKVQDYRFLAQTNLFALTRLLEKYPDMSRQTYVWTDGQVYNTHEHIANFFFVRKDPTYKTFKQFASKENYVGEKERLLLVPRGGFKSSLNMCDCVQWVIAFPE